MNHDGLPCSASTYLRPSPVRHKGKPMWERGYSGIFFLDKKIDRGTRRKSIFLSALDIVMGRYSSCGSYLYPKMGSKKYQRSQSRPLIPMSGEINQFWKSPAPNLLCKIKNPYSLSQLGSTFVICSWKYPDSCIKKRKYIYPNVTSSFTWKD